MKEPIKKQINELFYRYSNVESIDEINKLVDDINSTLRFIKNHMEYYDSNAVKQIFNIRSYLHNRRSKLARRKKIA